MGRYENATAGYKQQIFNKLAGTVVEIGPGTGPNLRYYQVDRIRWIGIEPNPYMHPYLAVEAERSGLVPLICEGTAERLPFADDTIDNVVSTLVLCSVADQRCVFEEILRVLKPGGEFVFIEHVAAPHGTRLRQLQRRIKPVWKIFGDGCEPDRDTGNVIQAAGFRNVSFVNFKAPVPIASPQICGVATK